MLPKQYAEILESYSTDRFLRMKQGDAYSERKEIKAGVPQGSALGPVLYLLYISDLPQLENSTVATFADDIAKLRNSRQQRWGIYREITNSHKPNTKNGPKNGTSSSMTLNRFILTLPTDALNTSQLLLNFWRRNYFFNFSTLCI